MKIQRYIILILIIFLIMFGFRLLIDNEHKMNIEQFQTQFDRSCVLDEAQLVKIKPIKKDDEKNNVILLDIPKYEKPIQLNKIENVIQQEIIEEESNNIEDKFSKIEKSDDFKEFVKQKNQIKKQQQQKKQQEEQQIQEQQQKQQFSDEVEDKKDIMKFFNRKQEIEDLDERDELLNYINIKKQKINKYEPEEIIRYHQKLKGIKKFLKKPKSYNCDLQEEKNIELSLDNNLKQQLFSNINNKNIKTLGLNQAVLLNPENKNEIMPEVIFEYQKDAKKRVLDLAVFKKNIIDKIKQNETITETNLQELPNSKISIWKKEEIQTVPYKHFYKILAFHKKELDKHFFSFIKNPINKSQIFCEEPQQTNCSTDIIYPRIYQILQTQNWYQFIFRYEYYIKNKIFAYTLLSKSFIHKTNNSIKIDSLNVVSITHEQDIHLQHNQRNRIKNVKIYNNSLLNKETLSNPYNASNGYLYDDNEDPILFNQKMQKQILKTQQEQVKDLLIDSKIKQDENDKLTYGKINIYDSNDTNSKIDKLRFTKSLQDYE